MNNTIRKITCADKSEVISMMKDFYSSPAVLTNGSDEIFERDIDACLSDSPYIEGYVFESNDSLHGYAMIAKSFSTEFGKPCIWIEDLYIKEQFRNKGIGTEFIKYIKTLFPDSVLRLEVEDENKNAVSVYKKCGFDFIDYREMICR